MSGGGTLERAHARVDLGAIRANVARLRQAAGPARLQAVVKADGYGHGAVPVARAALEAGADALAVATVAEAERLREAALPVPLLVMGPLTGDEWARAAAARAEVAVWTPEAVTTAAAAGVPALHLGIDTGMGRLGTRDDDLPELVAAADAVPHLVAGFMTHFATADERDGPNAGFMREQLLRFRAVIRPLRDRYPAALAHAANSAATLREPDARLDMVRCGIALYGCSPFHDDPSEHGLAPAMSVVSRIGALKVRRSRESVGYGRTWKAARGTTVALVPVGYADGYPRVLSNRAEVLVEGRRAPVVGTVSMDTIAVDLGPEGCEPVGAEVVLLGASGDERITAEELARLAGTINYEITCGVGPRVPRVWAS